MTTREQLVLVFLQNTRHSIIFF